MTLLTANQKQWLIKKTISEGGFYSFPRFGFTIYSEPNYIGGEYMDTNPFTRSLDGEFFLVKNKVNGFCKGNFYHNPKGPDMYITEHDLSKRSLIEIAFLFAVCFIPMAIYNCIKN